jgi:hypothetical protein
MKVTKQLIQDLVEAEHTLQGYVEDAPPRPEPGPPATAKELATLEAYLRERKLPLPPSYRAFLSICNGLKNFKGDVSMVSIKELMHPPHKNLVREYPSLSRFMIGRGDTPEFIAFDPDTAHDGELEVVVVSDVGDESRYPDLNQYLHARLKHIRRSIELEESDRKGLKD